MVTQSQKPILWSVYLTLIKCAWWQEMEFATKILADMVHDPDK